MSVLRPTLKRSSPRSWSRRSSWSSSRCRSSSRSRRRARRGRRAVQAGQGSAVSSRVLRGFRLWDENRGRFYFPRGGRRRAARARRPPRSAARRRRAAGCARSTRGESLEEALARAVDVAALAHVEQLETRVLERGARDRVPRARAPRRRARRRLWLRVGRLPQLTPDEQQLRRSRAGAPAREALVHEPRLRARAGDVHDLGAARDLRRRARPRRVGDEPAARARPPRRAGACRRPPRPGPQRAAAPPRSSASPRSGSR